MALTSGPLHSDDASGKFAKAIVFGKWKGRNYARQLVTPANPKSASQVGSRVMMGFLMSWWAGRSAGARATWEEPAAARSIAPYNAMVGYNMNRWMVNKGFTSYYPALETEDNLDADDVGLDGVLLAAVGHEGYISLSATPASGPAASANNVIIYRGLAAPTPKSWTTAIAILDTVPGIEWTYTDSPLDPNTYHYKIGYCGHDGLIGELNTADVSAVAT